MLAEFGYVRPFIARSQSLSNDIIVSGKSWILTGGTVICIPPSISLD